jgi:hypothetical protein
VSVSRLDLTCPHCLAHNDAHTSAAGDADAVPADGDVSFCFYCGELSIFDMHERCLRLPTVAESHALSGDHRLSHMRETWREVMKSIPKQ